MSEIKREFVDTHCKGCGIHFGFEAENEDAWRKSSKKFYCPNGCSLAFPKADPEIETLRKEIADLKKKLASSLEREETQKKKIEELQNEIDIWHPVAKETANG